MRTSIVLFVVLFVCALAPAFSVHAAAQFPDSKRLLPPPPQVRPDLSHNVNRVNTNVVYEDVTPAQPNSPSTAPAQQPPQEQNTTIQIVIAAIVAALAAIGLTLLWRSMRE